MKLFQRLSSSMLFAVILLALLVYASLSPPPSRDAAFLLDALIKERGGLDFLGDANARQVGLEDYRKELGAAREAEQLDTDKTHLELIQAIADAIIREAINVYPAAQHWDWEVHLIDSKTVNATCREGGKIIVYSGLIKALEEHPDQIATVLGHEVAHAILGHNRSSLSKTGLVKATTWIIAESLKMGPQRRTQAEEMLKLALLHPQTRRQEIEADILGVELAVRAGYDYAQASEVWRRFMALSKRSEDGIDFLANREASFTNDHPIDGERIRLIEKLAPKVGKLQNSLKTGQP